MFLITTRKKSILTSVLKRNPYTTGHIQKSYTVSAAKRCMMESLKLSPKWKWKPWVLWAWAERSLYFLSRWLLPFTTNVNVLSKRRFCGGRGGGKGGSSCYHTYCSETSSASETLVHQTLRQLHSEHRGQRVGEAGVSLSDRLIGWPENPGTAEETSSTSLRSQESSEKRRGAKVTNWSFISPISLSGIF